MDRYAKKHGERAAVLKFLGMEGIATLDRIIYVETEKRKALRHSIIFDPLISVTDQSVTDEFMSNAYKIHT